MKKKIITPEDLELNIEVTGGEQTSSRITETRNCTPSHNTCGGENGCNTTTPNPTVPDCKTVEEAGCKQTDACWTIEPECQTKVGCHDSNSNAQLCCPATQQNGCHDSADNCISAACADSVKLCQVTNGICLITEDNCAETATCAAPMSIEETCSPPLHPDKTEVC